MKSRRVISLLAVAALATTVFVGCGNNDTETKTTLKDGTYKVSGDKDDKGYTASMEIEVKDGKVATVKFDEVAEDGTSKLDNVEYNAQMKEISGTNPQEAYPVLEESLVETQDVTKVDTVTGATGTTETFKTLAEKALAEAQQ